MGGKVFVSYAVLADTLWIQRNERLASNKTYAVPDGLSVLFGQITMGWNAHPCQLFVESNSTGTQSATFVNTPGRVIIVVRWHNVHCVFGLLHWTRASWRRLLYFLV